MPQGPIAVQPYKPGGLSTAFNVAAPAVIKASPGVLFRIIVLVAGTAGSLSIYDNNAATGGTVANELFTIGYAALTVGQVITLEVATTTGIAVQAVTTGGVFVIAYS
jgi:hypothetical protein